LRVLSATGSGRFTSLKAQAEALFGDLHDPGQALRLFGGFAFQAGRAASPEWQAFGDARFIVPRLAYERRGDDAQLLLLFERNELADARTVEQRIEQAEHALARLEAVSSDTHSAALSAKLIERPEADFLALIELVRQAIDRGELEKLVLSRRVGVTLPRPVQVASVLRRLSAIAPECVRFAFRAEGGTFLGATPERLVTKMGPHFETEAVAGSIRVGDAPPGRLMESIKDRAEQAIVVRELLHDLEPIATGIDHAPVPEIHRLRHVAHLRTRIRGRLREPRHVLDLVERLHPTPAVGGVPSARALSWIADHEPDERGWYAGPIGWMDQRGNGAFAVALRSGLLDGTRAALYAGAGIVQGSDAANEIAETRWKLQALFSALGVAP
jgi:isochorismate synthase